MVLAGQACCRFSRFIRPIPLRPLGWVRCPSLAQRKREHAAGGVLRFELALPFAEAAAPRPDVFAAAWRVNREAW